MSTDTPLPLSLSCSWYDFGSAEADDPYFEKMAAQGQTFLVASGDSGGYTRQSPWPENSQYIIGVGGTSLTTTGPGGAWASETYWSSGGVAYGGGGWGTTLISPPGNWMQPLYVPMKVENARQPIATFPTLPPTRSSASTSAPTNLG